MGNTRAIVQCLEVPRIEFHNRGHLVGIVRAAVESEPRASKRCEVGVAEVNREPRLECGVARDSPPLEDPAQRPIRSEGMRNREFILVAGNEALPRVERRIAPVQARDQRICPARAERGILQARPIIFCVGICLGKEERQAMRYTLVQAGLQRMVHGVSVCGLLSNGAEYRGIILEVLRLHEVLDHTIGNTRGACRAGCRVEPRIQFEGPLFVPPKRSHVAHRQNHLAGEFALNRQVVVDGIRNRKLRVEHVERERLEEGKIDVAARRGRRERVLVG